MPAAPFATDREPMTRLPGRVPTFRSGIATTAPRSTLWLGASRVLQVNSGPMRDEYRRFYYRDIQALQLRCTSRGLVYNSILSLLTLFFALIAVATKDTEARVALGSTTLVCAGLLVVNVIRGPTVRCSLRTAVGSYPLPSLSRLRPAQRAFVLIRERVESVQGTLSDEAVTARLDRSRRGEPVNAGFNAPAAAVTPAV